MSTENHLGLPQEIFEEILRYLDVKDIFACSRVCVGWRNAANSNHVWESLIPTRSLRFYSSEESLDDVDEDENVGRCGKMLDDVEEDENGTNLTPLCAGRRRFSDYRITLKKNWREGTRDGVSICFDALVEMHCFISDETDSGALLAFFYENTLTICHQIRNNDDVNFFPMIYRESVVHCPYIYDSSYGQLECQEHKKQFPVFLKKVNSVLVVAYHTNLLHVFTEERGCYKIKLAALFDDSKPVPDDNDLSVWYRENCHSCQGYNCPHETRCDHNGKYFVGTVSDRVFGIPSDSVFHVWDLQSLTKIYEVQIPEFGSQELIKDVLIISLPNNKVGLHFEVMSPNHMLLDEHILASRGGSRPYMHVCCYDLEKMCYSSAGVTYDEDEDYGEPIVIFTASIVVLTGSRRTRVSLFDLTDGSLLATVDKRLLRMDGSYKRARPVSRAIKVFGNLLVFGGEDEVTVYNISELRLVENFRVHHPINSLHIHLDDLMIIGTSGGLFIRDMKTKTINNREIPFPHFIPPNPDSVKLLVWDDWDLKESQFCLSILQFW